MPSEEDIREALAKWQQELNRVADEMGRALAEIGRAVADDSQPYGCKCGESPRLIEGAHLSSCPHYSDEGAPPGYPVGHHDDERGPYPGVR